MKTHDTSFNFANRRSQRLIVANHHAILLPVDRQHVIRLARRKSQSLTLTNRKVVHAVVPPNDIAVFIHNLATRIRQRRPALQRIRLDKLHIIPVRHKAQLHAFRLLRDRLNRLSPEIEHTGGRRGWVGDSPLIRLDTTRIRELGWRPWLTIEQALARTLEWFDANEYAWREEPMESAVSGQGRGG